MGYRIGSFNCFNFGRNSALTRNLRSIATMICEQKMDIVALQEVNSQVALDMFLKNLNNCSIDKWEGVADSTVYDYAFIWNKRTMKLATRAPKRQIENNTTVSMYEPHIWKQYKVDKSFKQKKLKREPFYARFITRNAPQIEIRLINTHIRYSKGSDSTEYDLSEKQMRRNEFSILARAILPSLEDKVYGQNTPAYTILLGDYNLNKTDLGADSAYLEDVVIISDGNFQKTIYTAQSDLTTLKLPENLENVTEENAYKNNYDHFTYSIQSQNTNPDQKSFDERVVIKYCGRIKSPQKYCGNDFKKYRTEISDHVPILLEFDLK